MTTPRTKLWRPFESDTQRGQEHNLSPQQLQSLEEIFSRATVAVPQCVEHQISRHPNQAAVPFSPVSNPGIALPAVSKSRESSSNPSLRTSFYMLKYGQHYYLYPASAVQHSTSTPPPCASRRMYPAGNHACRRSNHYYY